jgi:hypothetical protein
VGQQAISNSREVPPWWYDLASGGALTFANHATEIMSNVSDDTKLYVKCMEETRDRLNFVKSVLAGNRISGPQIIEQELVFLQLRKILELVAFASLTANREKYAAAHSKFATHWRATQLLQYLAEINPDFYPMPVQKPQLQDGIKHMAAVDDFLTKDDFISLYDVASKLLHVGNPFSTKDQVTRMRYNTRQWIERIQALIALHVIRLVDGKVWVVEVPEQGPINLWLAEPKVEAATT